MKNKIILQAISAILALGVSSAFAQQDTMEMGPGNGLEKCYGIAKAGMNDCGTASHSCSGESKIDRDPEAWMAVPSGLCQRIAGGSTKAPEKSYG